MNKMSYVRFAVQLTKKQQWNVLPEYLTEAVSVQEEPSDSVESISQHDGALIKKHEAWYELFQQNCLTGGGCKKFESELGNIPAI